MTFSYIVKSLFMYKMILVSITHNGVQDAQFRKKLEEEN